MISLFKSGEELTLDNLRKTSRFSLYDGAGYYCSLILFAAFCFLVWIIFSDILGWLGLIWWICVCLAIWVPRIRKIILFIFSPLANLIQFVTTVEPEDWQMEQGLELAIKVEMEYIMRKFIFPFPIK